MPNFWIGMTLRALRPLAVVTAGCAVVSLEIGLAVGAVKAYMQLFLSMAPIDGFIVTTVLLFMTFMLLAFTVAMLVGSAITILLCWKALFSTH